MSLIDLQNVTKNFGKTPVLRGISLILEQGQQVCIKGPSGSGKSTLLYLLGGLDRPSSGRIVVNGQSLEGRTDEELARYRNREVGLVFQFHFLLPTMTCFDNICLPAKIGGVSLTSIKKQARSLASTLGVEHCLNKYPYEISGGEQQRINIIRAVSMRPKLLLCDEPTGNLDSENSERVTHLLKELGHAFKATVVVITHDEIVSKHFSQILTMKDGLLR